jgi:hypothetical protein
LRKKTNPRQFTLTSGNSLLSEDYKDGNIRIVNLKNNTNKCLLFCSGNGLYVTNTDEEYINKIRIHDRYEWENIAGNKIIQRGVSKIIFIRDIYKQWYVTGINSKINCIDKLIEYLTGETKNYKTIVAGNSAGGYAAVLIGILLDAHRIISISGQYNLWPFVDNAPLLKKFKEESSRSKYYDLRELLKNSRVPILYFFPRRNESDVEQYEFIKDIKNILVFRIDSEEHGAGIDGTQYPYIFLSEDEKIQKLYNRYKDKLIKKTHFYCSANTLIMLYISISFKIIQKILRKIMYLMHVKKKSGA